MGFTKKTLIISIILVSLFIGSHTLANTPAENLEINPISIETTMVALDTEDLANVSQKEVATDQEGGEHGADAAQTFLWIAIILIAAKLSSLVERFGQPAVLGELLIGVLLGNLILLGINFFEPIKNNNILTFLSELGVVILLFQIGLESNIDKMKSVGVKAFMVATVGVITPFILGTYLVGPWLMPGLSTNAYLFLGAALTATSVGITARVFKDLNKLHLPEAQIVLGAAVIDDVMGLIILAVISAMVTAGAISLGVIGWIAGKAILFLIGSIVLGQLFAPKISKLFSKIHTGVAMKFTIAISFGLIFAFLAQKIGLAPIVGAFAAGLILDPVHFRFFKKSHIIEELEETAKNAEKNIKSKLELIAKKYSEKHIEDLLEPLAHFVVPIFFVLTGMGVKLEVMFDLKILRVALAITAVAFIGKYVSGLVVGKMRKSLVGFGMVPRGEVGLIFASIGKALGVVSDEVFSIIVIMVIFTTLLTPPILTFLLKKDKN